MPLRAGTRFGPYEIVAQLGAGGMGEVYRARDSKLKRDVALKVLPDHVSALPDRVARLDREAELLAALNHPNIAHIYGFERSGGASALVMELVEGEDLAARLRREALSVDDALTIARQLAEALDAAHERGIVHRDLKPSNIRIRDDGVVKVLDFGLAKALEPGRIEHPAVMAQPTMTSPAMTGVGVILGTAAYMSPEQARGKPLDKRADVWAFGCVLFEMLTGRRPFAGETVSDTIAAIIERPPNWDALPPETPSGIRRLLARCLEKDARRRLRDAGDAVFEIEDALARTGQPSNDIVAAPHRTRSRPNWFVAAAIPLTMTAGAILGWRFIPRSAPRAPLPLVRLSVNLGSDLAMGTPVGSAIALAPDGQRIAFVANDRLFTRRLDQPAPAGIAGTEGAYSPFFSPDGRWVAFFTADKLRKVPVDGGGVITLCDAPGGRGGTWGDGDVIVAALGLAQGLSRVSAAGGSPEPLTTLEPGEFTHRWPQFLPGGRAVLLTSHTSSFGFDNASIDVVSLSDRHRRRLHQKGTFGQYFAGPDGTGYFTYLHGGVLHASAFDVTGLQVRGGAIPVVERVATPGEYGAGDVAFSRSGTLVYRADPGVALHRVDPTGRKEPILDTAGATNPVLSHDGQQLAMVRGGDIWVRQLSRAASARLTFDGAAAAPVWTRDDRHVVFWTPAGLAWARSDGGSIPQTLTRTPNIHVPMSVSSDGTRLSFGELIIGGGNAWDVWTMPLESSPEGVRARAPERFLATTLDERNPHFSPNGKWIVYTSNDSGQFQIYVRSFPDGARKLPVSSTGGTHPLWVGDQIFFVNPQRQIMAARARVDGDSLTIMPARRWSEAQLAPTTFPVFSMSADASRAVAMFTGDAAKFNEDHPVFLLNALDEFRRLLPSR